MRKQFHRLFVALFACFLLGVLVSQSFAAKEIHALVLADRTTTRMDPKIYYCFSSAARTAKTPEPVRFFFDTLNPGTHQAEPDGELEQAMDEIRLHLDVAVGIVVDLRQRLKPGQSVYAAVEDYIHKHPESVLAKASQGIGNIMADYDFLIVEPTYTTVIHPLFYNPDVTEVEVGYATFQDVKDTLCGLFFIRSALEQGTVVFGSCHGAQLGWLMAGGGLTRVSKYTGDEPVQAYFARRNPYGYGTEIWWFDTMLNNDDPVNRHLNSPTVYPLPEPFAQGQKGLYITKEVNHTLAMIPPIPPKAEVLSYHPMSSNQQSSADLEITDDIPGFPMITDTARKNFKRLLKKLTIIDSFTYKTLYGFQYHPQETEDEFDIRTLFEYLVIQVAQHTPSNQ